MNIEPKSFETIEIRPDWRYYILRMGWLAVISVILLFLGGMEGMICSSLWLIASVVTGLMALYEFIYLRLLSFTVTGEQLIIRTGVIIRSCNYLELYRIVDFTEHQELLLQLLGLKTVIVYSTDRTSPKLQINGICQDRDIVSVIRNRVIYNRTIRNIHEFSNLT